MLSVCRCQDDYPCSTVTTCRAQAEVDAAVEDARHERDALAARLAEAISLIEGLADEIGNPDSSLVEAAREFVRTAHNGEGGPNG